jgi:hypothetical protein
MTDTNTPEIPDSSDPPQGRGLGAETGSVFDEPLLDVHAICDQRDEARRELYEARALLRECQEAAADGSWSERNLDVRINELNDPAHRP